MDDTRNHDDDNTGRMIGLILTIMLIGALAIMFATRVEAGGKLVVPATVVVAPIVVDDKKCKRCRCRK